MPINIVTEDEKTESSLKIAIIIRLWRYLASFRKEIIKALFLIGFITGAGLLNPYFMKLGIDRYIAAKDIRGIIILGAIMAAVNLGAMICTRHRIRIMSGVSNSILLTIRQKLYTS